MVWAWVQIWYLKKTSSSLAELPAIAAGGVIAPCFWRLSHQQVALSRNPSNADSAVRWHAANLHRECAGSCPGQDRGISRSSHIQSILFETLCDQQGKHVMWCNVMQYHMHMIIYLLVYVCRSEKSEQVIAQPAEPPHLYHEPPQRCRSIHLEPWLGNPRSQWSFSLKSNRQKRGTFQPCSSEPCLITGG